MDITRKKIEYLAPFMTDGRFEALKSTIDMRTDYITVCIENIFHPQNASAVIRSCEAFGVQNLHAIEAANRFTPNENIVRGTDKWVDIHRYDDGPATSRNVMAKLRADGYRIVATSPHAHAAAPEEFDVAGGKFALFFGAEHEGISDDVREGADEFIKIPMYGFVESLNVSVCAAILLYILSRKVRAEVPGWQLPQGVKEEILLRWMMGSVRESGKIMKRFKM